MPSLQENKFKIIYNDNFIDVWLKIILIALMYYVLIEDGI